MDKAFRLSKNESLFVDIDSTSTSGETVFITSVLKIAILFSRLVLCIFGFSGSSRYFEETEPLNLHEAARIKTSTQ